MPRPLLGSTQRPATSLSRQWIFGYASLAHAEDLVAFLAGHGLSLNSYRYETLTGYRRTWSVAMDNTETVRGYKYYVDAATGERPELIAFANIEPDAQARTFGILFEACERMLAVFDARERNYDRVDVTSSVDADVEGTVWCYVGSPQATERYREGLRLNTLVLDRAYVDIIASAFARAQLDCPLDIPNAIRLLDLTRVDT